MHLQILISVMIAAMTGLIAKMLLDRYRTAKKITWTEYLIVMTIITLIAAPGSVWLGWHLAKKNLLTFNEYWNGWETKAYSTATECYRDGPCSWEYDCDPYLVPYSCNCDDKGNCSTCYRTEYHDCPYVTHETNYYIETTIGRFTIADNRFPSNPQEHRWRKHKNIPDSVIERAGIGKPEFWTAAKERIENGQPGPATRIKKYENYIYASESQLLMQFSADIDKYEKAGLLPAFQKNIYNHYYANKAYFVGWRPENLKEWYDQMSYFNAAFGQNLEGDMHLVIAKNELIAANPDAYLLSLKAYWQNTKLHGMSALSKNSIVAVVLTDGEKVIWARAFSGMPLGNEQLLVAISNRLRGQELKIESVMGKVSGTLKGNQISCSYGSGVLEDTVFGLTDQSTAFKRVSMKAEDKNDHGSGFLYKAGEIRPTKKQILLIYGAVFLLCCVFWTGAIIIGDHY